MPLSKTDTDRYLRDLEFILDVTRETLSTLQLTSLLRRVVHLLRDRFGYDYAAVALIEEEEVVFRAASGGEVDHVFRDEEGQSTWRIPVGHGIVGTAASQARAKMVNDVEREPEYLSAPFLPNTRSELAVPLVHRDEVLGVLDVQSNRSSAFDDTDVRLLEIVSALVAPAVRTAKLYEHERTKSRDLHLVGEISRLVMSSLDLENVITVACEAILEALNISFVAIVLLDRNGQHIVHGGHATRLDLFPDTDFTLEVGEGLAGEVISTGEPRCVGDVSAYPNFRHMVPGMQSALCLPLQVKDRVTGAVDVEHSKKNHFSEDDRRLLENITVYLAQAVENAQLFDNQRNRWQQLLVINEVARIVTGSFNLEEILLHVANEVHDRFSYFAVVVKLLEDRDVVIRALKCDAELELGLGHREPLGEGIAGTVVQEGILMQADSADQFTPASALRPEIQSILCVPLRVPIGVIGALEVQSLDLEAFDSDDRLVMQTMAQSVAGAIANARSIQQTEQLRDDLNRMIVHDLRNPVQAVLLTLQEVQRAARVDLSTSIVESVSDGISCSEDILEMVNSLLDLSRFEAGKAQLRLLPTVLNDHIRAVVKRLAPHARAKRIQTTTVLSQDVPVLRLDHDLISRMIANLVGNAIKFTPEGARVTIKSELILEPRPNVPSAPPVVLVSIQDTGEGIPAEYHDKIFEKFGQVESRKAGLKMSTGLGLTLCRYVIEAHGGEIWVQSTTDKGSTFFFTLQVTKR